MKKLNCRPLLTGTSALALAAVFAPLSFAQVEDQPAEAEAEQSDLKLNQIVVTATRRATDLQDTAVAVTSVDAEFMAEARVENIGDITAVSPSVTFRNTSNPATSANLQIRGIGTTGANRAFEGAVGVFVDGVYRTRPGAALQNFLDVGSLQVLRGPQGTLFGKNTSAGAILLESSTPVIGETGGDYSLSIGNYEAVTGQVTVNAPIGDKAALRLSGISANRSGFFENPNTGEDYNERRGMGLKGQFLYEPTDTLRLRIIADHSRSDENCCFGTVDAIPGPVQDVVDQIIRDRGQVPTSRRKDEYQSVLNIPPRQVVEDTGYTVKADWDVGPGKLSSVTALRQYKVDQMTDADFSGADLLTLKEKFKSNFFSQEFSYSGDHRFGAEGSADYVAGIFYSDEKINSNRTAWWGEDLQEVYSFTLPPTLVFDASAGLRSVEVIEGNNQSFAVFGQWDGRLNENWGLTAGLRWSQEEKQGQFENLYYRPNPLDVYKVLGVQPAPHFNTSKTDEAFSGTLGVQYHVNEDAMLYASYNRGFKAGGVNLDANAAGGFRQNPDFFPGAVPGDPTYDPEYVNAYELGLKTEFWASRARANFSAFYNDMTDLQVARFVGTQFQVLNSATAEVYGAEVESAFELTEDFSLDAAVTWLSQAELGEDPTLGPVLSGRRFAIAPELSGSIALRMDKPVTDSLSLVGRVQTQYSGGYYTGNSDFSEQGGYALTNLNFGIKSVDGWTLEAWLLNAFDKRYVTNHFSTTLQSGDVNAYMSAPRTFGVTLRGSF
ncbi:transporter, outer membrane receptor (OMR) family [Hyphomonas neptunium ATCC 15444]|uniref:Transporter, outer membrane receptor (OMR) family n=2 Tax=Hyphomonas TaxID=85 RepID=Q0BZK9_HYPNA|nr:MULTISPECIES: TonB-dependent receptor [Hyphomonas]ABI76042.1 transporter, outer membrane receptor (OMR) family [Hyphomonas neptunium ATCC 15444]KCZ95174.1 outer membrane receptor (OMR) family protein [Hyphomonas hirschiana VP5]